MAENDLIILKEVSGEWVEQKYVVGTSANNIVQLDGTAKLPAVDGSQLTGIVSSGNGVDGGSANSVYLSIQNINGGDANG